MTVGTGFPDAEHSKVTSVPFLTTILPSSGFARTLGGTDHRLAKDKLCGYMKYR